MTKSMATLQTLFRHEEFVADQEPTKGTDEMRHAGDDSESGRNGCGR